MMKLSTSKQRRSTAGCSIHRTERAFRRAQDTERNALLGPVSTPSFAGDGKKFVSGTGELWSVASLRRADANA